MVDHEPTVRSRELGLTLSRAAKAKGKTGTEIAQWLGWSDSKVSRLFTGKRGATLNDVSAILAVCGIIPPKRDELMEVARRANESGWWQEYGECLPPELRTLSDYEDAAITITNFQTDFVPGLLQVPTYAHALLHQAPAIPAQELELRVNARRHRQEILDRRHPAKFCFYLDEYVLRRTGPGRRVMSEQVHYLLQLAVRPHIEIRIIPDEIGFHAGNTPFHLMTFTEFHPVVHIETDTSVLFLERPDTIAAYTRVVSHLDNVALDERRSRDWLSTLASELGAPREEHHGFERSHLEEEFPH
jgi:hypothetical protein